MMPGRLSRSALVALLAILAGCPKSDPKPETGSTAAADGVIEWFAAQKAIIVACYGSAFLDEFDAAQVEAVAASVQAAVDAGRLTYDASAKDACVASMEAITCDQLMRDDWVEECIVNAYLGNVANGGDCLESIECEAGWCDFTQGTCPGSCTAFVGEGGACSSDDTCAPGLDCDGASCVAPTVVVLGGECDWNTLVCAAGSFCGWDSTSTTTYRCAPLGGLGAECGYHNECEAPYVCDMAAVTPTCMPYAPPGDGCVSAACNEYVSYCSPTTSTCAPFPTLGDDCGAVGACDGSGVFCDTSLGTPVCSALPVAGGDCTISGEQTWPSCGGGADCLLSYDMTTDTWTGTCVAPGTAGETCEAYSAGCVAGYYCNAEYPATGTCVAQLTSGACDSGALEQCAAGYHCDGVYPAPGNCVAQKAAGDSCVDYHGCADDLDCMGGVCTVYSCY